MTGRADAAPPAGHAPSRFLGRALVSVVGIAVVAWLALTTKAGFTLLLSAALFAGGYEYRSITAPDGGRLGRAASGLGACMAGWSVIGAARAPIPPAGFLLLAAGAVGLGVFVFLSRTSAVPATARGRVVALAGPVYFGVAPAFLLLLQDAPNVRRGYWVALALAVSWGGGIGGYLAGRLWGRHPLAPSLSPRKTVEGAVGALLLGCGVAMLVWSTDRVALPLATALWLVPSAQLLSQTGDLIESGLKRRCGAKDSGRLLLEQGGILDSIDGFCLAAPWLYFASGLPWR